MEQTEEGQLSLRLLLTGSKLLGSNTCNKLRSYLNTHGSIIAQQYNLQLPFGWTNKNNVCPYCCTPWSYGDYTLKLLPTVTGGKKIRAILKKLTEMKKMSNIEEKLALQVHSGNKLLLKCLICKKSTSFLINKDKSLLKKRKDHLSNKIKQKKKKKKDKFAGLTPVVVKEVGDKGDESEESIILLDDTTSVSLVDDPGMDAIDDSITTDRFGESTFEQSAEYAASSSQVIDLEESTSNIRPLGMTPAKLLKKSEAEEFIPINSLEKAPQRRPHLTLKVYHREQLKKERKFANPFAIQTHHRKKQKKLNQLQQLIKDQQEKAKPRTSLKDFLSIVE